MIENFPYGKAPFWLALFAALSTVLVLATRTWGSGERPALVMHTFARNHLESYQTMVPEPATDVGQTSRQVMASQGCGNVPKPLAAACLRVPQAMVGFW